MTPTARSQQAAGSGSCSNTVSNPVEAFRRVPADSRSKLPAADHVHLESRHLDPGEHFEEIPGSRTFGHRAYLIRFITVIGTDEGGVARAKRAARRLVGVGDLVEHRGWHRQMVAATDLVQFVDKPFQGKMNGERGNNPGLPVYSRRVEKLVQRFGQNGKPEIPADAFEHLPALIHHQDGCLRIAPAEPLGSEAAEFAGAEDADPWGRKRNGH